MTRIIAAALLLLIVCGCASSKPVQVRYDQGDNTSTYETTRVLLGYRDLSAGLAGNQRVMWQAVATCAGRDCTPDEVALVFYNDTNTDLNLDYRHLQLDFDGTSRRWEDLARQDGRAAYAVPRGEFVRVPLSGADFAQLANAGVVEVLFGMTGTIVFSVPFAKRASFRAFAEETGLSNTQ